MPFVSRADQFAELPPERLKPWRDFGTWPDRTFFPKLVGLRLDELRLDYARMSLPFRPELNQPHGLVHGGAIATLVDSVVVPAIGAGYDEDVTFSTIDMQIRYLGAVRGQDMIAEGIVTKRGRSILFCNSTVFLPDGSVVADGTLTYKLGSVRTRG